MGLAGGAAIGSIASGNGAGTLVGGVVGGVIGGVIGDSIQRHQTLQQQLAMHDVHVIEVGDKVKIVIPVDNYYVQSSPRLNAHYYPVLNKVAEFMRSIPKESVKVSVFTDNVGCEDRNLALTRGQARAMAAYLWREGIDARFIYSAGYGSHCPIAYNQLWYGRAQNRRVEITFWRIAAEGEFS